MNYIQELKDYHEFLQWDDKELPDYNNLTQDDARIILRNDLEFILGTNGLGEMYDWELKLMKKLGFVNLGV